MTDQSDPTILKETSAAEPRTVTVAPWMLAAVLESAHFWNSSPIERGSLESEVVGDAGGDFAGCSVAGGEPASGRVGAFAGTEDGGSGNSCFAILAGALFGARLLCGLGFAAVLDGLEAVAFGFCTTGFPLPQPASKKSNKATIERKSDLIRGFISSGDFQRHKLVWNTVYTSNYGVR